MASKDAVILQFMQHDKRVGGVVLKIHKTNRNEVEFLYTTLHGQDIGTKAWKAIELTFPATEVWELYTPYFEKRNIHFYINKCGFHIVEFFHRGRPLPHTEQETSQSDADYEFFRFEKCMQSR